MQAFLQEIPLAQIDCEDFSCSIWAFSAYESIKESIQRFGLQTAPILLQKDTDCFLIVSGQKRIRALKDLGTKNVPCNILPKESEIPILFLKTIWENLSFRNYNLIEKSMLLRRMEELHIDPDEKKKILACLLIPLPHENKFKSLLSCPKESQKAIALETIAPQIAFEFAKFDSKDQKSFLSMLQESTLNPNKQNEIWELLSEISKIENVSFSGIFGNEEVSGILKNPGWNGPQKSLHLRRYLRKRRYPIVFQAEKEFESVKSKVHFPRNIKLENQTPFEDDSLQLRLSIKNTEELKKTADYLKEKSTDPAMIQLIRLSIGLERKKPV